MKSERLGGKYMYALYETSNERATERRKKIYLKFISDLVKNSSIPPIIPYRIYN